MPEERKTAKADDGRILYLSDGRQVPLDRLDLHGNPISSLIRTPDGDRMQAFYIKNTGKLPKYYQFRIWSSEPNKLLLEATSVHKDVMQQVLDQFWPKDRARIDGDGHG